MKKEAKFFLILWLVGVTLVRLLVADRAPLVPDEAYYWVWSRALAAGYLDHPPMVALWIRAGTAIAGPGALGIRLLAPFAAAFGTLLIYQAGEDLFPARRAGLTAALLLNATLMFGVGAVTMTPDTPLLFFWTVCLWAMARLHRTRQSAWWLAAGLATGLAMASKYTAILLPAGLFAWCLLLPRQRIWLTGPMAWLAAALASITFLPVLLWNAAHGWASFAKQGSRGFVWHPLDALRYVAELIGGQVGLATPLIFALCVAAIITCMRRCWRQERPAEGLVLASTLPAILLFCQHALGDRVQANWPAIIYPGAVVGVTALSPPWQRLIRPAAALGALLTAIVYIQVLFHPITLPARQDPAARLAGWPQFAAEVAAQAAAHGATFIAADNYATASMLARSSIAQPVIGVEPRWRLFSLPPFASAAPGLLVRPAYRGPDMSGWNDPVLLTTLTRGSEAYSVYMVRGVACCGAILPRLR